MMNINEQSRKIIITITSWYKKPFTVSLLNARSSHIEPFLGLREDIFAKVKIVDGDIIKEVSYKDLLLHLCMEPMLVGIGKTTNNRQLHFYGGHFWKGKYQLWPTKDANGNEILPIEERAKAKYEMSKDADNIDCWNIADSKELFIMDAHTYIDLKLDAGQTFEIEIEVASVMKPVPPWKVKI